MRLSHQVHGEHSRNLSVAIVFMTTRQSIGLLPYLSSHTYGPTDAAAEVLPAAVVSGRRQTLPQKARRRSSPCSLAVTSVIGMCRIISCVHRLQLNTDYPAPGAEDRIGIFNRWRSVCRSASVDV